MSITIPSKKIYNISNPKVRDNVVGNVNIALNNVTPNNEYDITVYNEDIADVASSFTHEGLDDYELTPMPRQPNVNNENTYRAIMSYVDYYGEWKQYKITIPRAKDNYSIIDQIFRGDEIKVSVYYEHSQGEYELPVTLLSIDNNFMPNDWHIGDPEYYGNSSTESLSKDGFVLPSDDYVDGKMRIHVHKADGSGHYAANATVIATDYTNYKGDLSYSITEDEISFTVYFLKQFRTDKGGGILVFDQVNDISNVYIWRDLYELQKVEISVKGNTKGISVSNGNANYGTSENTPFKTEENELIQDSGLYGNKWLAENIAENILSEYKNGKETCELTCSISDYYDEEGKKVVSISDNDRMTFLEGDVVVPMIRNSQGVDIPMSRNKDGSAKKFTVYGVDVFYDGAVWQKLSLQETGVENG